MSKSYYIITGQDHGDEQFYWNNSTQEWTIEIDQATQYTRKILCEPLPEGTTGIAEVSGTNKLIGFYEINTLPYLDPPL